MTIPIDNWALARSGFLSTVQPVRHTGGVTVLSGKASITKQSGKQ